MSKQLRSEGKRNGGRRTDCFHKASRFLSDRVMCCKRPKRLLSRVIKFIFKNLHVSVGQPILPVNKRRFWV